MASSGDAGVRRKSVARRRSSVLSSLSAYIADTLPGVAGFFGGAAPRSEKKPRARAVGSPDADAVRAGPTPRPATEGRRKRPRPSTGKVRFHDAGKQVVEVSRYIKEMSPSEIVRSKLPFDDTDGDANDLAEDDVDMDGEGLPLVGVDDDDDNASIDLDDDAGMVPASAAKRARLDAPAPSDGAAGGSDDAEASSQDEEGAEKEPGSDDGAVKESPWKHKPLIGGDGVRITGQDIEDEMRDTSRSSGKNDDGSEEDDDGTEEEGEDQQAVSAGPEHPVDGGDAAQAVANAAGLSAVAAWGITSPALAPAPLLRRQLTGSSDTAGEAGGGLPAPTMPPIVAQPGLARQLTGGSVGQGAEVAEAPPAHVTMPMWAAPSGPEPAPAPVPTRRAEIVMRSLLSRFRGTTGPLGSLPAPRLSGPRVGDIGSHLLALPEAMSAFGVVQRKAGAEGGPSPAPSPAPGVAAMAAIMAQAPGAASRHEVHTPTPRRPTPAPSRAPAPFDIAPVPPTLPAARVEPPAPAPVIMAPRSVSRGSFARPRPSAGPSGSAARASSSSRSRLFKSFTPGATLRSRSRLAPQAKQQQQPQQQPQPAFGAASEAASSAQPAAKAPEPRPRSRTEAKLRRAARKDVERDIFALLLDATGGTSKGGAKAIQADFAFSAPDFGDEPGFGDAVNETADFPFSPPSRFA